MRLFSGWVSNGSISIPGVEPKASRNLNTNAVGPEFARTTGMRLLAGRDLAWSDVEGKRRVAVVTEEMARYFFGDLDVLGRRYSPGNTYDPSIDYEIVGVVSNARYSQVRGASRGPHICRSRQTAACCAGCISTSARPAIHCPSRQRFAAS